MPVFTDSLFIHFDKRNWFVFKIEFKKDHFFATARALDRVISERKKDVVTPCVHVKIYRSLLSGNSTVQTLILFAVSCINAIIPDHFEMFFRDVPDKSFDKIHDRNRFDNQFFIFMPVVMKGDGIAIIMVNPFCGDDRASEISADVFNNIRRITFVIFGINIEAIDMIFINVRFNRLEGRTDVFFKFIEECSTEGVPEVSVIKVGNPAPDNVITTAAFRNETVNMGIPFEVTPKSVENTNETGDEVFRFIDFVKHTKKNTSDSRKETIQKASVFEKEMS